MNLFSDQKLDSPLTQVMKIEPNLITFLKEGDIVEAKILEKSSRTAYFDLGRFGTGVVCGAELLNAKNIIKNLNVGDSINVKITNLENEDGYMELSLVDAQAQKKWQELKELKEKNETALVKISGANSGGLIAILSEVKCFLPVSQLAAEHYPRVDNADRKRILEELRKLVGQELSVKIIDLKPASQKVILSEKEAMEENLQKTISAQYKIGDVIEGIVSGVADFGVFVRFADNPAIEGLIHISELAHRLIDNPKEVAKLDEAVQVKIIEIKDNKIFLSLKALKPDPWVDVQEKYKEGQEVMGSVYKINPFGALIDLDAQIQGIIHVAEFGSVEEMQKQLKSGEQLEFVISAIKPEEKRIILKLK